MNVLELLSARSAAPATTHGDGAHIALAIEGGGMRAVIAAGMAEELQRLGLVQAFDTIHGSSAGALIAAFTTADQASVSADIFCAEASSRQFIDPLRFFSFRRIMDLHWMVYDVFTRIKPMNFDRIINRGKRLCVVTTSATTGAAVELTNFKSQVQIQEALEASALLPLFAGRYVELNGEKLCDGGISQRIPIQSAIDAGATHIVLLLTQRWLAHRSTRNSFKVRLEALALWFLYGSRVSRIYLDRNDFISQIFANMDADGTCIYNGVAIQAIFPPPDAEPLGRLARAVERLRDAREAGHRAVRHVFGSVARG